MPNPVNAWEAYVNREPAVAQPRMTPEMIEYYKTGKGSVYPALETKDTENVQSFKPVFTDEAQQTQALALKDRLMGLPENQREMTKINSQEEFLKQYMQAPIGFDFKTAVGGLASFFPKSSAANLYKVLPENDTAQNRAKTVNLLQNELTKAQAAYNKNIADQLKTLLGSGYERVAQTSMGAASVKPQQPNTRGIGEDKRYAAQFIRDWKDRSKTMTGMLDDLDKLQKMDKTNIVSTGVMDNELARIISNVKGAMSEGDVKRNTTDPTWGGSIQKFFTKGLEGTYTKKDIENLNAFIADEKARVVENLKNRHKEIAEEYTSGGLLDRGTINAISKPQIDKFNYYSKEEKPKKEMSINDMILQELRKDKPKGK